MSPALPHFLIVYRRSSRQLIECVDLGTDGDGALKQRFEREKREKNDPDVEVVLLSAQSLGALKRTHSRYFETGSTGTIVQDLITSSTSGR